MIQRFYSFLLPLVCLLLLIPSAGEAFVPQAPHLLHLVLEKIKEPAGIEAYQTKKILNYGTGSGSLDIIEEKLVYSFPGNLRTEVISEGRSGFSVETDFRFVKVAHGQIVATEKSPADLYTDILLYRDHESMLAQLSRAGIDTGTVSIQRYNDKICFVIGSPSAGLWIDKETFFPLKYVIRQNGWSVEFFYNQWQRVSRTWYPMNGSIFIDSQLFAAIEVSRFELKARSAASLFDLERIRSVYPGSSMAEPADQDAPGVNELDQSIENFKKLYE